MKLQKLAGATSEIWQVFIRDSSSTTGGGLTGLVFNSAGLSAYYHRDTDTTATAISLVTMTVGTFTSSGFKEIDAANMPGWYQFCPPNAALASGAKSVGIHLKGASNMAPMPIEVQLMAVNLDSATSFVSSVPSVVGAVGSVTGLTASDVGAIKTKTDSLTFTVAGMVDSNVVDWKGSTAPAMTGDAYARIGAAGAGLTALGDTRIANLDATVSSRSTYAGADTSGTTTLLGRLTSIRAGLLDNLDAAISTRSTYAGGDTSGTTTLLARLGSPVGATFSADIAAVAGNVWSVSTRLLTAGTNIALAKGTGVTGFTDLDAAGVRGAVGLASANLDTQLDALPTNADLATALAAADDATLAAIAALTIPTAAANAAAVLAAAFEGAETVQDFFRLARASLYGKANGLAGTTVHYRDAADTKNRLTATVDGDGNRSSVAVDAA